MRNPLAFVAVTISTAKLPLFVAPVAASSVGPPGRTAAINSPTEWCMFLPPKPGQVIGMHEYDAVAFCTSPKPPRNAPGARTFPKGFITSSHYQKFEKYVQVTGRFNPDKYKLSRGDGGGQFDMKAPFRSVCAGYKRYVNLVEPNIGRFCIRCCKENDKKLCNTFLSEHGCEKVIKGNYGPKSNTAKVAMEEFLPPDFTPPASVILTRTVTATPATPSKTPEPSSKPTECPQPPVTMEYPDVKSLTFVIQTAGAAEREPIAVDGDAAAADGCVDLNPGGYLDWSAVAAEGGGAIAYATAFVPAGLGGVEVKFFAAEDCGGVVVYELEADTTATGRPSAFDLLPHFFGNYVGPQSVRITIAEPKRA